MKEVARICFKHWLKQSNVLFIIGGKSNNTDIFETLRAMADALREHFSKHGPTPLYVVLGRGGPNLVRGMGAIRDTCEALGLPYRIFGFDSDISGVIGYAKAVDAWMKAGGRERRGGQCGKARPPRQAARLACIAIWRKTMDGKVQATSSITSASARSRRWRRARTACACSTYSAANRAT